MTTPFRSWMTALAEESTIPAPPDPTPPIDPPPASDPSVPPTPIPGVKVGFEHAVPLAIKTATDLLDAKEHPATRLKASGQLLAHGMVKESNEVHVMVSVMQDGQAAVAALRARAGLSTVNTIDVTPTPQPPAAAMIATPTAQP